MRRRGLGSTLSGNWAKQSTQLAVPRALDAVRVLNTAFLGRLYSSTIPSSSIEHRSTGLGFQGSFSATRIPLLRANSATIQQLRWNQTKASTEASSEEANKAKQQEPESEAPKDEKEGAETKDGEKEKEKEAPPPPPPPHGDKSVFAVFYETIQKELKTSQEWQESTKAISHSAHQFTESPAVRKAREAYEASAKASADAAQKGSETLKKTAKVVGDGAAWTWNTPVVKAGRTVVRKTGEGVAAVTKPVRETKAYQEVSKNVKEVIDDGSSSRYGGFIEKEERKKLKEAREAELAKHPVEKLEEDPK